MKPLLICLALLCTPTCVLSQGVVAFRNDNLTAPPDRLVRCIDMPMGLTGTTFAAQLLYGTDPDSLTPHPTLAYFRAPGSASPGTWSGGNRTLTGAGGVGTTIFLQVAVWDSGPNRTVTFDQARANRGYFGVSQVFSYQQGLSNPPDPVNDTKMSNFVGFTNLSVPCVPEPSVGWLLLPTAIVMWLLKRRTRHSNIGP